MTARTRSPAPSPSPLLAALAARATAAAFVAAGDVTAARSQYWATIDRLASGDDTGGIDVASFAAILAQLCFDFDKLRTDLADVQRVRKARADLDAVTTARADAEAEASAASAAADAADADAKRARDTATRAAWQIAEATAEASRLRLEIRDELRDIEAGLRAAGFVGELLAPPPPPPPKRRWRFRNGAEATLYANLGPGCHLEDGSEVDMPADYCGMPADGFGVPWATCIGTVTPDMPPPKQTLRKFVPVGQRDPSAPASLLTDASALLPPSVPPSAARL